MCFSLPLLPPRTPVLSFPVSYLKILPCGNCHLIIPFLMEYTCHRNSSRFFFSSFPVKINHTQREHTYLSHTCQALCPNVLLWDRAFVNFYLKPSVSGGPSYWIETSQRGLEFQSYSHLLLPPYPFPICCSHTFLKFLSPPPLSSLKVNARVV